MMNKVILVGVISYDPEIKRTQINNAGDFLVFKMATEEYYVEKDGRKNISISKHNVTVFCPEVLSKIKGNISVGDMVYVNGQIKYSIYEKDGNKVPVTNIVVKKGGEVEIIKKSNDLGDKPIINDIPI